MTICQLYEGKYADTYKVQETNLNSFYNCDILASCGRSSGQAIGWLRYRPLVVYAPEFLN
jgi:hypothetical protein